MPAADQSDHGVPSSAGLPANIRIRAATAEDAKGMADCFFTSFYPSSVFWQVEFGPKQFYQWWIDAWTMGIEQDATMRTFIAVDTSIKEAKTEMIDGIVIGAGKNTSDGRVAAFCRWRLPQEPDELDELWPELPESGLDMDVMGAFFGGMHHNRSELMKGQPHWFLQMLGTSTEYQGKGIGKACIEWGCRWADKEDMEVYIDASMVGAPQYIKHGAVPRASIPVPDRLDKYEPYKYMTHVRPRQSVSASNTAAH